MTVRSLACKWSVLFMVLLIGQTCAYGNELTENWGESFSIQAIVGVVQFEGDDLKFDETSTIDPTLYAETDLSEMPVIGGIWQKTLRGEKTVLGFEGGILFSWKSDDVSARGSGGSAVVRIDNSIFLLDLSAGLYVHSILANRIRLYAAGGPVFMLVNYDVDFEDEDTSIQTVIIREDESVSEFGVGGYVRAGVEIGVTENGLLGIGVRGVYAKVDLDDVDAELEMKSGSVFVTFTVGF
jgi:opacity protein-like surface antigen